MNHKIEMGQAWNMRVPVGTSMTDLTRRILVIALVSSLFASAEPAKPTVIVNLNDHKGLTITLVPGYPEEARKNGLGGTGLYQLHFNGNGVVTGLEVLISTEHKLLDQTATAALRQWRCRPGALSEARITMVFRANKSDELVAFKNPEEKKSNFLSTPRPRYPSPVLGHRATGSGIFMLRFRPDGAVDTVAPVRSTGSAAIDKECIATFSRWRCVPGAFRIVTIPVTFTTGRCR